MNKKISRLIFELSKNSRATTKQLSKALNISQQTASYMILNLNKKKMINYSISIDPARFGLINILILFEYKNFDSEKTVKIRQYLMENTYITYIEDVSQGADLMIEYCVPNFSLFNKQNREFIHKFKKDIRIIRSYVVIVKHVFTKKYLHKKHDNNEIIISGDRNVVDLNKNQRRVLKELRDNPKETILKISKKLSLNPKTVASIKKSLEKSRIIRRYSVIINHSKAGISRQHIFVQLDYEDPNEIDKFIEFAKNHKNVIAATKIIGDYELMITAERFETEKPFFNELRKRFKITDYRMIECDKIIKSSSIHDSIFE